RAFGCVLRRARSVPSPGVLGASLLPSSVKASTICSWFFCRLSLIESYVLLATPYCSGLRPRRPTLPSADFLPHGQNELLHPQSRFRDMQWISRRKSDRLSTRNRRTYHQCS